MGRGLTRLALPLVLVAALAGPALPSAEEDEGVLARLLQTLLSDAGRDVRIRGFEGALSSRATIREISIADAEGVWITLSDVVIDWNRAALLDRRIEVNELGARRVDLMRAPTSAPDDTLPSATARADFALPELPVSVRIGEVRADLVHLGAPVLGQVAEVTLAGSMQLAGGQGETRFEARRTDGTEGEFQIHGSFDNTSRILALDMTLSEGPAGIAATLLGIPDRPALGLVVQGNGPISTFEAGIALSSDGQPRVAGRFALVDETPDTGVLDGGGFSLDIEGNLRPLLAPDLHAFFGETSSLRARGQRSDSGEITLPELAISTEAMELGGSAALSAQGVPQRVNLTARVGHASGEAVLLPGTSGARLQGAELLIGFDAAEGPDWSVRARLDQFSLPDLRMVSTVLDGRGRFDPSDQGRESGDSDPLPVLEGVFEFAAEGIEASDPGVQQALGASVFGLASLSWSGGGAPIALTGLAFEGETVSLTAHGQIDGLSFDGFVEFEAPDLGAFSGIAGRPLGGHALASFDGRVNPFTGAMDIEADLSTRNLTLDIPEADVFLAGQSVISVSLARDTEGTVLRALSLQAGTAEVFAQGTARPGDISLSGRMAVTDLARLGEGYGGRVALDTEVSLRDTGTRLRLDGTVVDLQLGALPAAGLVSGLLQGATRLRANLFSHEGRTEIALFDLQGPRLGMTASGVWSDTAPDATVVLDRLDLAALGPGGRGTLGGEARIRGEGGARRYSLSLGGPGPLASGIQSLDGLIRDGVSLDAAATTDAAGALTLDEARLASAGATIRASGTQSAAGRARFVIEAALADLAALVPGIHGQAQLASVVTREPGATRYGVTADLSGPSDLRLALRGHVNDDQTLDLALDGQVQGVIANPTIEPSSVQGLIRFDGTMRGPAGLDALRLQARVSGGRFAMPAQYMAFHDIEASAQLIGAQAQVRVSGVSQGGGSALLEGTIRLDRGRAADLALTAQDLVVGQPNLFDAQVSGRLRLAGQLATGARLSGTLDLAQAEIRIPNSPLARSGVGIAGLRHVGEDAASRATRANAGIASGTRVGSAPVPLDLDLVLNAPGRVFVRGRGLDAELGGSLRLGGTTRATVPAGSFQLIRGRLDLLGNRFVLTDGSASMIGSFLPFIRLTATTESGGVLTSVTLAGQADSPEITFSSVPELPQDEVLARLIFRRALTSLSPFQAAQLALSVATLTGRADDSILGRTRAAMGLDDLDFTVDAQGNTQLRAGRALGERVYTDVSVDSAGRGEVSINLNLSPSVTLRGRADTQGGSGIGLFFERDY